MLLEFLASRPLETLRIISVNVSSHLALAGREVDVGWHEEMPVHCDVWRLTHS